MRISPPNRLILHKQPEHLKTPVFRVAWRGVPDNTLILLAYLLLEHRNTWNTSKKHIYILFIKKQMVITQPREITPQSP